MYYYNCDKMNSTDATLSRNIVVQRRRAGNIRIKMYTNEGNNRPVYEVLELAHDVKEE